MLINRDLPAEVRAYINASTMKKTEIAERMGASRQQLNDILTRFKHLNGNENWIRALDAAGYDVEVRIKPKKK